MAVSPCKSWRPGRETQQMPPPSAPARGPGYTRRCNGRGNDQSDGLQDSHATLAKNSSGELCLTPGNKSSNDNSKDEGSSRRSCNDDNGKRVLSDAICHWQEQRKIRVYRERDNTSAKSPSTPRLPHENIMQQHNHHAATVTNNASRKPCMRNGEERKGAEVMHGAESRTGSTPNHRRYETPTQSMIRKNKRISSRPDVRITKTSEAESRKKVRINELPKLRTSPKGSERPTSALKRLY